MKNMWSQGNDISILSQDVFEKHVVCMSQNLLKYMPSDVYKVWFSVCN
jgi:hypothetical protein